MSLVPAFDHYPLQRLPGMPSSPLQFITQGFKQLLSDPRRMEWYTKFRDAVCFTRQMRTTPLPGYLGRMVYAEKRDAAISHFRTICQSSPSIWRIFNAEIKTPNVGASGIGFASDKNIPFLYQIFRYLNHDISACSPNRILGAARRCLSMIHPFEFIGTRDARSDVSVFPPAMQIYSDFAEVLEPFFAYFERQVEIGEAFFAPDSVLPELEMLTAEDFSSFGKRYARGMVLRFLSAFFDVRTSLPEKIVQNIIVFTAEEGLQFSLPLMLLGPKIACDIKNSIRVVDTKERERLPAEETDGFKCYPGCSLVRHFRGLPIEEPVLIKVEARKTSSPLVWELRVSDNGKGIIVEQMFDPLVKAAKEFPDNISPAIKNAALAWEAGDALAFNNIPYGDLLEAVFHLGVSVGSGDEGTGMGLWGSAALLLRLGAQIRVGVTPGTGGFYESIYLPVDLSVPASVVESVAPRR